MEGVGVLPACAYCLLYPALLQATLSCPCPTPHPLTALPAQLVELNPTLPYPTPSSFCAALPQAVLQTGVLTRGLVATSMASLFLPLLVLLLILLTTFDIDFIFFTV